MDLNSDAVRVPSVTYGPNRPDLAVISAPSGAVPRSRSPDGADSSSSTESPLRSDAFVSPSVT